MRALFAMAVVLLLAHAAAAQQVELRVGRGPHYVGVPVEVQIIAEGFAEDPVPEPEVGPLAAGRLAFVGVSPNISSQVTIINGRVSQSKQVQFVYRYRFWAARAGTVELGPFRVAQGGTVLSTRKVRLAVSEVPLSDRLRLELRVPEHPLYLGARVSVRLEWWLDLDLRKNLHGYTLRAPLFDLSGPFQFIDAEGDRGQTEVKIETSGGTLKLHGKTEERMARGRRYLVVSVTRTLVPLEVGKFEIAPATIIVNEGTRWQRELFGGRRATRVRKLRAADRPQSLEVRPLPRVGRGASFAGAIGKGFSLDVAADRTVVKVGDPIRLTLKLRGEGNLESAGLPPLSAEGGLSPTQFRLPDGDATGLLENGEKSFVRVVRVLDPAVREIPAIAYTWFDLETGTYRTTRSRPIALAVHGAEVVRAEDVVSTAIGEQESAEEPQSGMTPSEAVAPEATASRVRVSGADLAIERDPATLLRDDGGSFGSPWLWGGLYGGPVLLVLLAWLERRRAAVDPALIRRRKALRAEHRRIRGAVKQGDRAAAAEVSSALRKMLAEVPQARSAALDTFLAECDAVTYSPAEEATAFARRPEFEERARSLSDAILESIR
jgi:hypothetical protein